MKPSPHHTFENHSLGHVSERNERTVFFGGRDSTLERLKSAFPDYEFVILKQTHSDIVRVSTGPCPPQSFEGDAHWTRAKRLALCVRTADCLPILIHDPETGSVAAIHAGWRGIENEIIRKTCVQLQAEGSTLGRAIAWLGPHIEAKSFEVGLDVAAKLEARFDAVRGFSGLTTALLPHADSAKKRVDLLAIASGQLRSCGFEPERMSVLAIDTFTSNEHASFRRDKTDSGRQISFIALK